jgi:hypothetical protein
VKNNSLSEKASFLFFLVKVILHKVKKKKLKFINDKKIEIIIIFTVVLLLLNHFLADFDQVMQQLCNCYLSVYK